MHHLAVLIALGAGIAIGVWTMRALDVAPTIAQLEQRLAEVRAEAIRLADACRTTSARPPSR